MIFAGEAHIPAFDEDVIARFGYTELEESGATQLMRTFSLVHEDGRTDPPWPNKGANGDGLVIRYIAEDLPKQSMRTSTGKYVTLHRYKFARFHEAMEANIRGYTADLRVRVRVPILDPDATEAERRKRDGLLSGLVFFAIPSDGSSNSNEIIQNIVARTEKEEEEENDGDDDDDVDNHPTNGMLNGKPGAANTVKRNEAKWKRDRVCRAIGKNAAFMTNFVPVSTRTRRIWEEELNDMKRVGNIDGMRKVMADLPMMCTDNPFFLSKMPIPHWLKGQTPLSDAEVDCRGWMYHATELGKSTAMDTNSPYDLCTRLSNLLRMEGGAKEYANVLENCLSSCEVCDEREWLPRLPPQPPPPSPPQPPPNPPHPPHGGIISGIVGQCTEGGGGGGMDPSAGGYSNA